MDVSGIKPAQLFHFLIDFKNVNVIFGYDLLVEPIKGTDGIRCSFSPLTDPPNRTWFREERDKGVIPVALSNDLTPLTIKSGDTISITMLPLVQGKRAEVTQYLRLTRVSDYCAEPASESAPVCSTERAAQSEHMP